VNNPSDPSPAAQLYDALGQEYEAAFGEQPGVGTVLADLLPRLPSRARVLDLGAGTGRPVASAVAALGHDVTGYDVSQTMVDLARGRVPGARFELADMRTLAFADGSWDAVLTMFSMLQLPQADQRDMVARIARWLTPGGFYVLATVPHPPDCNGRVGEWMGHTVETFSFPVPILRQLIDDAGLRLVREDVVEFAPASDQADVEPQVYMTARKPAAG
jgi:SAM-dependent methyltransferase